MRSHVVVIALLVGAGLALGTFATPAWAQETGDATAVGARPTPRRVDPRPADVRTPPRARPAAKDGKDAKGAKTPGKNLKKMATAKKKKPKQGWFPRLRIGATTSIAHTHQVPGVTNGLSVTLGGVLDAGVKYLRKAHRWESALKIMNTQSKTPTIVPFVKTADQFDLWTEYAYRFKKFKQLSVFTKLHLFAPMLPGDLVTASDTALIINEVGGTTRTDVTAANQRYRLTGPFDPLIFKQIAGAALVPYKTKPATLTVKASLAGQEVFASGLTVDDNKTTPETDLKQLQSFQQLGFQIDFNIVGKVNKVVSYAFESELMFPLVTSIDTPLSGFELLNAQLGFKVSVKMAKWASLDYIFAAKRFPVIVNRWQVTNNLVLSFSAQILGE